MRKKDNLPFAIAGVALGGIILSDISIIRQRKTNTVWYYLYVESKKSEIVQTESRMVVTRSWVVGGTENWGDEILGTKSQPVDK